MVLRADSYTVMNKSLITDIDKKTLIDLYQQIIRLVLVELWKFLGHQHCIIHIEHLPLTMIMLYICQNMMTYQHILG